MYVRHVPVLCDNIVLASVVDLLKVMIATRHHGGRAVTENLVVHLVESARHCLLSHKLFHLFVAWHKFFCIRIQVRSYRSRLVTSIEVIIRMHVNLV